MTLWCDAQRFWGADFRSALLFFGLFPLRAGRVSAPRSLPNPPWVRWVGRTSRGLHCTGGYSAALQRFQAPGSPFAPPLAHPHAVRAQLRMVTLVLDDLGKYHTAILGSARQREEFHDGTLVRDEITCQEFSRVLAGILFPGGNPAPSR